MKFKLNDVVKTREYVHEVSLPANSIGVVIVEFTYPEEAYEIEFCNELGETIAQLPLTPDRIILVWRYSP